MEENKIMNEEIMEITEDLTTKSGSGLGGKVLIGALVAGGIYAGYKFLKKRKAKKEDVYVESIGEIVDDEDIVDVETVEKPETKKK